MGTYRLVGFGKKRAGYAWLFNDFCFLVCSYSYLLLYNAGENEIVY